MKILHTADWHLGKILYSLSLEPDHKLFLEWLDGLLKEENIDAVLLSGDVFDQSNPSNESRKLYYDALNIFFRNNVQVIITGGNHDSSSMLNAPSELLCCLNINVIGGVPENMEKAIFTLKDKEGNSKALVAAVPFLKDKDIREFVAAQTNDERIKAVREGVVKYFKDIYELTKNQNTKNLPIIGMGHLYVQGSKLSESERDIQVGNAGGIDSKSLDNIFDYFALGHIHIPHRYGKQMRYSGSPIPLNFSEKLDEKIVIVIEIDEQNVLTSRSVKVPVFRNLVYIHEPWTAAKQLITSYQNFAPLPPVYEVLLKKDVDLSSDFESEVRGLKEDGHHILKIRLEASKINESNDVNDYGGQDIFQEISPKEIFEMKLSSENLSEEEKQLLTEAHNLLYNEIIQS
jgi:DNA repair protein SbcD/Mre11